MVLGCLSHFTLQRNALASPTVYKILISFGGNGGYECAIRFFFGKSVFRIFDLIPMALDWCFFFAVETFVQDLYNRF